MMNHEWDILLIGGNSGTGKTTLARQLGVYYQLPALEVDDIRLAMQEIADRDKNKDLFGFLHPTPGLFEGPYGVIVDTLYAIGEAVFPGLKIVIENHSIFNKQPVILEGDGMIPGQINSLKNLKIKAIFLWDDKDALRHREKMRIDEGNVRGAKIDGRPQDHLDEWLERYTSVSYLFGQKIKKEAEQMGYKTLKASPIETLFDRSKALLEENE